jgi:hypothetical protein
MKPDVKCPAGEEAHPVLSRNAMDVRCRVQGGLRPAVLGSPTRVTGEPVVCCDQYERCGIWRTHKDIVRSDAPSTKAQRDATVGTRRPDVLRQATRDRLVV